MSDPIGHYCGVVCLRLKKPILHYVKEHGDAFWGLRRLYLLMEKQRNRGQDGAGIAVAKFDMEAGQQFIVRKRSDDPNPTEDIFRGVMKGAAKVSRMTAEKFSERKAKKKADYLGEVMIGHLRYGTYSGYGQRMCQPYIRRDNQPSRNIAIAGNFNLTNAPELMQKLVEYGLHPSGDSDTQVVLEKLSYALDQEHDHLRATRGPGSLRNLTGRELAESISSDLDLSRVLANAAAEWDGGYVFAGLLGNGDAFVCRDPSGIRPAFWYEDDEVVAAASERAALVTVFDAQPDQVLPVEPAHALVIKRDGRVLHEPFTPALPVRQCTFERIYFSRGNDRDIYDERKMLGRNLAPRVLDAIDHDIEHTVFSFIPNTAETAFYGLIKELERVQHERNVDAVMRLFEKGTPDRREVLRLIRSRVRIEKAAHKDQKLRTFITRAASRSDLVSHVYDITPGVVTGDDTLVVIDDSIVRGTTLRDSIITMLARLHPKSIVVASSSPPILYPDCYGIDMSNIGKFIGFEAAVSLLHDRGESAILGEIEDKCRAQQNYPPQRMKNHVRDLYERFTLEEISAKVAELLRSDRLDWKGELRIVYQTIDGLRAAMPEHTGDWYFTGEYPTPGGYRVLNRAFLNWIEHVDMRAY